MSALANSGHTDCFRASNRYHEVRLGACRYSRVFKSIQSPVPHYKMSCAIIIIVFILGQFLAVAVFDLVLIMD